MMLTWIMILQVLTAAGATSVTQVGPFASQAACEQAGRQAAKSLAGEVRFACVPFEVTAPEDRR